MPVPQQRPQILQLLGRQSIAPFRRAIYPSMLIPNPRMTFRDMPHRLLDALIQRSQTLSQPDNA
jgi:hypothetical protein